MEFSIGSLAFKVEIKVKYVGGCHPRMSKWAKRHLAKRILAQVTSDTKIDRIKVLRQIAIDEGWYAKFGGGLKAVKDWVEEVFADNGAGEIAI